MSRCLRRLISFRYQRPSTILAWYLGLNLAVCACSTTDGDDKARPKTNTYYTLQPGDKKVNPAPLPAETPIAVDWHHSDGSSRTIKGFRGFDFDGDGRFEMVEVLKSDGSIQSYVYDFDSDGRVDQITPVAESKEQSTPVWTSWSEEAPMELVGPPSPASVKTATPSAAEPFAGAGVQPKQAVEPVSMPPKSPQAAEIEPPIVPAATEIKPSGEATEPLPDVKPVELEPVGNSSVILVE